MNLFSSTPLRHSRSTQKWNRPRHAVKWWDEDASVHPTAMRRRQAGGCGWKATRFAWSLHDLWEIPAVARKVIVGLSVVMPLIMLTTSKRVREHWERANPEITAHRLTQTGQASVKDVATLFKASKESPSNPKIFRALATAVFETDPAEARLCYHKIQQLGASTVADHAAHARLLARLQDFAGARAVMAKIPSVSQQTAEAQRAWLTLHQESNDFVAADNALALLEKLSPTDARTFLNAATAAVKGKARPEISVSLERRTLATIKRAIKAGMVSELNVADQIVGLSLKDPANRAQAAEILRVLPNIGAEHRIAAVRFEHPTELSGPVHEDLCNAYRRELMSIGGLSAQEKDRVAKYLQREAEHALVVELIGLQESYTERPLFERRMDSLLQLGKWRDAAEVAAAPKTPEIPQSRCLFDALKALRHATSGHPAAESVLPAALDEALDAHRAVACYAVGCMALEYKLKMLATDAFTAAADVSDGDIQIIDGIISTARQGGLTAADVLQSVTRHACPTNHEVQERLCYLRLISGQDLEATHNYISSRRQQNPTSPYLKMLDALQQYKAGNFVQSAQTIVPLPAYRWRHGEAGVLAAIMAAAGKFEQSSALLSHLDIKQLFPEEISMIDPWQTRMQLDKSLLGIAGPADKPVF